MLTLESRDRLLNLLEPALRLHLIDRSLDLIVCATPKSTAALVLIEVCNLSPKMPAAGVDYQKQPPIFRTIHLDEVVPTAKGADASHRTIEVDLICATQLRQIEFRIQRMDLVSHLSSVGDLLPNQRVQTLEIDLTLGQFHRFHAAADINADHAWNDFVPNGHGGTNRTALASVDIRHNADLAARKFLLITDRLDLGASRILQCRGIAESGII